MDEGVSGSITWTHTVPSDECYRILQVFCACGLAHQVEDIKLGGVSLVDCVCGRVITVEH